MLVIDHWNIIKLSMIYNSSFDKFMYRQIKTVIDFEIRVLKAPWVNIKHGASEKNAIYHTRFIYLFIKLK